jgi:hypothetical protein
MAAKIKENPERMAQTMYTHVSKCKKNKTKQKALIV